MERLFFAVLPGAATRGQLAAAAQALPLADGSLRVPPDNYHATLAFVGEVAAASVPMLREIGAAQRGAGFTLRFDAYEYWPKPEVVVAGSRIIPPALEDLWQRLHASLAVHHWALQPKRLRPHVTLARKIAQAPVLPAMSSFDWTVNELSLMRSEPGGAPSAYTVVDAWPLLYEPGKTSKNSVI